VKVLLTGATGFVGSRILRKLVQSETPTRILIRSTASTHLIGDLLDRAEVHNGSLEDETGLRHALEGIHAVIHCAGKTKALHAAEFQSVNRDGTARLIRSVNDCLQSIRRVVHLSSLAAGHPATSERPSLEQDPPDPVSAYGQSKLDAERFIQESCRAEYVLLRAAAVYGPGDADFLQLFRIVKKGLAPRFGGGRQALSLVYADDLAEVSLDCLTRPGVAGSILQVAHPEVFTSADLVDEVATALGRRVLPLPLPRWSLVPLSWWGELVGRWTGKPQILSVDRRRELMAPGWVCSTRDLERQAGKACPTGLRDGIRKTADWYRQSGWL